MVLCLLSRDSHGDTGKLNHEETVRGPEIAIFPEKSEILLLILVKISLYYLKFWSKYLCFHHDDPRVAAVPESLSLLHSYLCM